MSKICGTSATRGGPNLLRITLPARLLASHFPPRALSTVVVFSSRLAVVFFLLPHVLFRLVSQSVARFPLPPPLPLSILSSLSAVCLFESQSRGVPRIFAVFLFFVYFQCPSTSLSHRSIYYYLIPFDISSFLRPANFFFFIFRFFMPTCPFVRFLSSIRSSFDSRLFHFLTFFLSLYVSVLFLLRKAVFFKQYILRTDVRFFSSFSFPMSLFFLYIYPFSSFCFPLSVRFHIYLQHVVLLLLAFEPKFVYHSSSFHGIAAHIPETNVYKRRSPFRVIPCS